MKIISTNTYRDGGTKKIETDQGTFWLDNRISSTTKGRFYRGAFPGKEGSIPLDDEMYELQIHGAMLGYENLSMTGLSPREQARKIIVKFFNHGKLNIIQARQSGDLHIDLLIELGHDSDYWESVRKEMYHKMFDSEESLTDKSKQITN